MADRQPDVAWRGTEGYNRLRADNEDVEQIVRQTLAIVDRTTPLSVGEPLVQRILARLRSPESDR